MKSSPSPILLLEGLDLGVVENVCWRLTFTGLETLPSLAAFGDRAWWDSELKFTRTARS